MAIARKIFMWLAIAGVFAAAVWFGFVQDVDGARHLAIFWVWGVVVPFGFFALTNAVQAQLARTQRLAVLELASRVISWCALGIFVWAGHFATAFSWCFWMLASAVCRECVRQRIDKARET